MEWGKHANALADQGNTKALVNQPEMVSGFEWLYEAFFLLSASRQVGMGLGPIPIEAMAVYADHYPVDDFEEFVILIRHLDSVYLSRQKPAKDGAKGAASG